MTLEAGRSQWDALTAWLMALPADQHEATLTIGEIELLIGKPLSTTARTPSFWTSGRHMWGRATADFTARLDYDHKAVTFTRRMPGPP